MITHIFNFLTSRDCLGSSHKRPSCLSGSRTQLILRAKPPLGEASLFQVFWLELELARLRYIFKLGSSICYRIRAMT